MALCTGDWWHIYKDLKLDRSVDDQQKPRPNTKLIRRKGKAKRKEESETHADWLYRYICRHVYGVYIAPNCPECCQ